MPDVLGQPAADGRLRPCDEDTRELARRWARDATALSDWKSLPPQLDVTHPEAAACPRGREEARAAQERVPLRRAAAEAQTDGKGGGLWVRGGHQTLPLAYHFPDATFVLVDAKARSLEVAERRAAAPSQRAVRARVHRRF